MKIAFIYRSKDKGGFSIENVFNVIAEELEMQGHEIIKIYHDNSLLRTLKILYALKVDHYHVTGDVYYLALFLPKNKITYTLHDIGSFKNHEKNLKIKLIGLLWFMLPSKYVKKFSVISDLVKNDMINYFNCNKDKMMVINNPMVLNLNFEPKKFCSSPFHILQIGSGDHKNLIGLIEAVKDVENVVLEIIGSPTEKLIQLMNYYKIKFNLYKKISNEAVEEMYRVCDLVYFASFSEGFGLPILEAQAVGKPVITSNILPMTDVAGLGAFYVNPNNPDEIRRIIQHLMDNYAYSKDVIKAGKENLKRFDKRKVSEMYINLFQSVK